MNPTQELQILEMIEEVSKLPDVVIFWYCSPDQYEPDAGDVSRLLKPRMSRTEIANFERATGIETHIINWGSEEPDNSGNPPPAMLPLILRWDDPRANAY